MSEKSAPEPVRLRITSDPATLAPTRKAVEAFAVVCGFGQKAVDEIGLCVNEAIANVIRHAYHGKTDQPIEVELRMDDSTLKVSIRDWGEGKLPNQSPPHAADPMKPGGLGLICMGRLMDRVSFTPQPDGMLLEMIRRKGG